MNRDLPKLRGIIMKNWMSAKGLVIGALLLLGSSVAAGDGDCTDKNPGCDCTILSSDEVALYDNTFCLQPRYYVPPIFPKFTALQPASRIRDPNSNDPVTLNCQISPQNAATNFSIIWEHNGVPINNLSMYEQNSLNGMSTLTIRRPSLVESEGRYRCRVNYHRDSYGNFSLVSREANFETPSFFGWVDSISGNATPIMSNTTILAVREGESFVLECNPRTNDPSISAVSAVWTRNHRRLIDSGDDDGITFLGERNSTLLIWNFSSSGAGNGNVTFQCLFGGLRYLKQLGRRFIITPDKGQAPEDFLVPQSQTVLPGSRVTLHCLSKAESSISDTNTWLFRNITINQTSQSNHYDIVAGGRVLVIRNISMETSGEYTCRTASGEDHSAFVQVLNTIFISSTTHNFTGGDDQIDIETEASIAATTNHTISLSCHAGSRLDDTDYNNDVIFEWFFRGRPIESPSSNSESQNVTFIKQGNTLTMMSEDPWQLIGIVQCLVSIASPTGEDQLHEVKSASVHILARGKPNPPCSISLQRMDDRGAPFKYQLGYYNSSCSPYPGDETIHYVTEILVRHNQNRKLCTCNKSFSYLNFDTTEKRFNLLAAYEKNLSFRVALSVSGALSDFLPFVNHMTGSCEVPLVIDKPPPTPTFHGDPQFKLVPHDPYPMWNVTQEWNTTDECNYPSVHYNKYTSLSCPEHMEYNTSRMLMPRKREFSYSAPCRVKCTLTVSVEVYANSHYTNHNTTTITTPSIAPIEPPTLDDVIRVNETSFKVYITVVNESLSCVEELPYLVVNYTRSGGGSQSSVSISFENCTNLSTNGGDTSTYTSYICGVTDDGDSMCLDEYTYEVRVAYRSIVNREVHFSDYSIPRLLQAPTEESVLDGVESVNAIATSTNEIAVNFSIFENVTCIAQRDRLITAHICLSNFTCDSADPELDPTHCQNQSISERVVNFQNLLADSAYCVRVNISYGDANRVLPDTTVYTHATTTADDEGRTTTAADPTTPADHGGTTSVHAGVSPDQTVWKAVVGAASVLCVLIVCISIVGCCYHRRRMKSMRNYHRLHDNDSITSQDPVDPAAERAESVHSASTDPEFMVRRLLKDIKGQPDGDEDHTCLYEEDYADHQGDGEFEGVDVERESLQGFGDAEEMAEHESRSSSMNSSSLEDRRTLLSNIQKENQAYQASKQQEVAVELSPLRTHPSLITSPSPTNANGGVPLSIGQRIVPNGYVGDLNVSVGSEGFRNLTCRPRQPLVGGNGSFNLIDSSSSNKNGMQNLNLQPPLGAHNISADGYVQESVSVTNGGNKSTPNLNPQPPLGTSTHLLSSDGYVQDPTSLSVGGDKREERGPSAESGNEEDSLSNEGDSNSVFDDDLIPSENPTHSLRPRSTVTSGFQSGSSESASSPEPPKKSTSSTSSLLSPASTVVPPSTLNAHAPPLKKDKISPSSTDFSLLQTSLDNLSSNNSFTQHMPHLHSSSSISPTSVVESTFTSTNPTYRPSSMGGSSGYVTNESSQSYTYHSSSATSQTSQTSGLAQSELEQEFKLEDVESQQYTIPSLLMYGSKSSSPAISRAAGSNWTANDTSAMQTDFANTRHCSHGHHFQATNVIVVDYVNTSDVDLNKISTDLGALSQASDTNQDVSFVFSS